VAEHFDVIIVGAGISGIDAAYHLQRQLPQKTFTILEARDTLGGTWDLFRYPGIRSDSDMFTLGFPWRPWRSEQSIADGASILQYVRDSAREQGIDKKIRYRHRVTRASFSSERARWTLEVERDGAETLRITASFVCMCSGYYRYSAGYTPDFVGTSTFRGRIVHPQHWTDDIDYAGKRVIVIGSGATAMTLVPALTTKAAHVTMLQRSPTYVVSMPAKDPLANALRKSLPPRISFSLTRWKNISLGAFFFQLTRRWPERAKERLINLVREALGPDYDVDTHFTPRYNVWDQRVCLIPDGDLFEALKAGSASIVTAEIDRFTPQGILLRDGQELEADLIVTATGLEMEFCGGAELIVDGRHVELKETMSYKGCMVSDVPNLAFMFGYTNASWTLKADLTARYVCRLLRHMDSTHTDLATPRCNDPRVTVDPMLEFTSGYVQRAQERLPKQGSRRPYRLYQNYWLDLLMLRFGRIQDRALELKRAAAAEHSTHEREPVAPHANP
jgi:cation diffusion facilitator CzcD-associated flavoprotein CzcO